MSLDIQCLVIVLVAYFVLLFILATYAEKRERLKKSIVNNPIIYALSLAVYCTAWTYFGSIGRASTTGYGFLPIYLGPTIMAPLCYFILLRVILISKDQRINSIADFISARYGKSTWPGVIVATIALIGIIPYISIQLKAIVFCLDVLSGYGFKADLSAPIYEDKALYAAIILAVFTILFGVRHADPNERHEGLVTAIAFESIFKLVAFLAAGIFIVFGIYNGFDSLFEAAAAHPEAGKLLDLTEESTSGQSWFFLIILSGLAVFLLPRQFHVAVVENTNPAHLKKAMWLFPLYLLLINIFVLPIALAGIMHYSGTSVEAETFILQLPLDYNHPALALIIALGGISAAASMVMVAVTALTIMVSNNIFTPIMIRTKQASNLYISEFHRSLIGIRRVIVLAILLLAFGFYKSVSQEYSIVSIGLISFAAVVQFAPALIGGIIWKRGTQTGAVLGMIAGIFVWMYTLPVLNLIEVGFLPIEIKEQGLFGFSLLKPNQLFGLQMSDNISHAVFWSLLINISVYYFGSLFSRQTLIEAAQADYFVDFKKYYKAAGEYEVIRRSASVKSLKFLLSRYLGEPQVKRIFNEYENQNQIKISDTETASTELVNFAETNLAGALGAASARVVIKSVVHESAISFDELLRVLDRTQEAIIYSNKLEQSQTELEDATNQLRQANSQLKELDTLKAEFISTVTHELRTPITSIKSLANILIENDDIDTDQSKKFLSIIAEESDRISRIVSQVLDTEKAQIKVKNDSEGFQPLNLSNILKKTISALAPIAEKKKVKLGFTQDVEEATILGNFDNLMQIFINLISNAIKFSPDVDGRVEVTINDTGQSLLISIADNGIGIQANKLQLIFDKFVQVQDGAEGKPSGSGLGLYITKKLVEQHDGRIWVESKTGEGSTFFVVLPKHTQNAW